MADHPRSNLGLGALAGALAGAGVGIADGVRAGLLVGGAARVVLGTAILAASVDALVGLLGGAAVEAGCRFLGWGRRARLRSTPAMSRRRSSTGSRAAAGC